MSGYYRVYCEGCDWVANPDNESSLIPDFYQELILDDKTVPLRHPLEYADLAAHGYTWERAVEEDRLAVTIAVLCKNCGRLVQLKLKDSEFNKVTKSFLKTVGCRYCNNEDSLVTLGKVCDQKLLCPKCKNLSLKCDLVSAS